MPSRAPSAAARNVCIFRFARTFDGLAESSRAAKYRCRGGPTDRLATSVTKSTTVHRADGFAHFSGRAEIINANPQPAVVLFKGTLDLIARIGSHPGLGEACAPETHVEGWFAGKGRGDRAKMSLRVIVVGSGQLAEGTNAFPDASQNRMIGALLLAP